MLTVSMIVWKWGAEIFIMIHRWTTLFRTRDWTNERTIWMILPAELTDRNWTSTSSDEIQLCFIVVLPDYRRFCGAVKMKRNVSFCKTFSASSVSDVTISDSKRKELSFRLKKQTEVVTLVINRETNQQLQLWCYYNVVFVVYLYISGSR